MKNNKKSFYYVGICIVILFIQNLVIFWNHYFNKAGFPWDFDMSYYATTAFWTSSISKGIFPEWIPFQLIGYPFALNAQTGFNYPMLWTFPLLGIEYTLSAAIIFQILHVFFGSVGMFFLLKTLFKSPYYALIGAIAFQFFGGFYANSEHVDIVRALAISPWLFYVFTLNIKEPFLSRRNLFIPIVIFLLGTGGYFGNLISTFFIMILFIFLQGINSYVRGFGKRSSFISTTKMLGLLFIGIVLLAIQIGPILDNTEVFSRLVALEKHYHELEIEYLPSSLFMSNRIIPGEISMTSTYLTLPMLILASYVPLSSFKRYWPFLVVIIIAILMSMGHKSFFWQFFTDIFWPLNLSRFPVSDYRAFITIPIMIFAILGLKTIIEEKINFKTHIIRGLFITSWFIFGTSILFADLTVFQITLSIITIITTTIILVFNSRKKIHPSFFPLKKNMIFAITFCILIMLVLFDGSRVISDMSLLWMKIPFDQRYNDFPLEKDGKLVTFSIFENLPTQRPEREITKSLPDFSWKGYLIGSYMMQDYTGTRFNSQQIVMSNDNYKNYMLMKWTPLFFNSTVSDFENIPISDTIFSDSQESKNNVKQTYYGINEISYLVSLKEPLLMVENEMYFPGWKATLIYPEKEVEIDALVTNKAFRSWLLPSGDYEMKAYFQFPNLILYKMISVFAFVIWISIIVIYWKKNKKQSNIFIKN